MNMRYLSLIVISGLVALNMSVAYGDKPKTEKEWEICRDKVFSSKPHDYYGADGGAANDVILNKCGQKPVVKTKKGYALSKNDCDGIYQYSLRECYEGGRERWSLNCNEGVNGLSRAASSWIGELTSRKVFDPAVFNELCKQVCKSKRMPDRKTFGKMICGGS